MDSINRNQPENNRKDLSGHDAVKRVKDMADDAETCFFVTATATGETNGVRPMSVREVDDAARQDGLLMCPEGGATLAAYRDAIAQGLVDPEERTVLFNCATGLKYPMPAAEQRLDRHRPIDFDAL